MAYVEPMTVISPRNLIRSVDVLYNGGPGEWSVAVLHCTDGECLGIRWNGSDEYSGNPQSHGHQTWFRLPHALADGLRAQIEELANSQAGGLLERYREMANDQEHEAEALEWSEGLIGDAITQEG
jgi:hypothetical protein